MRGGQSALKTEKGTVSETEIILYGDGNILWKKKGIDASTVPEYIAVDVTDVDVFQIYMEGIKLL